MTGGTLLADRLSSECLWVAGWSCSALLGHRSWKPCTVLRVSQMLPQPIRYLLGPYKPHSHWTPGDWGSKAQDQELVLGFWCSRCAGLPGCPMASPVRSRLPLPHTPQKENNPAPGGDCGNFMSSLGGRKRDEFYFTALPFLLEQGKSLFFSVL